MQCDVQVAPEHLGHRGLRAQFTPLGDPGHGTEGVQPVRLRLDPRVGDPIGMGRVGTAGLPFGHQPLRRGHEPRRAAQRHAAFVARRAHRRTPALVHRADDVVVGNEDVVQENLPETGVAAELGDRPHRHAVGLEVEHEVGQPAMALGGRVGSEQPECPVPERCPAAPDLLPVEQPAAVGLGGGGPQGGQVAPGLRLGPGLRPDLFTAGHFG